ncbi:MAG: hypothetical protein ACOYOU_11450 [Kiritimatiellia bacterium]
MNTTVMFPILLLALAFLWLVFRRGAGRISRSRAPRPWHPAVRIVCGVLGIGLLFALSVGTWREVRGGYGSISPEEPIVLHLPAKPAPELPNPTVTDGNGLTAKIKNARLLLHMVLLRGNDPLYAKELDIRFPEDAGKTLARSVELGGARYSIACKLTGLVAYCHKDTDPVRLIAEGNYEIDCRSGRNYRSNGKDGRFDFNQIELAEGVEICGNTLSLVHRSATTLRLLCRARLVDNDDSLKLATLADVADGGGVTNDGVIEPCSSHSRFGSGDHNLTMDPEVPPACRLLLTFGTSSIILILAAALLAQVFVRRGLAFAGKLAICLGYAAALDRLAVGFHARRLADKQQPMEVRVMAAEALRSSYFYKETASRAAEQLVIAKP